MEELKESSIYSVFERMEMLEVKKQIPVDSSIAHWRNTQHLFHKTYPDRKIKIITTEGGKAVCVRKK